MTIRRPSRIDGIAPIRTHSYALDLEMPSTVAAWVTVMVAGPIVDMQFLHCSGSTVASSRASVKAVRDAERDNAAQSRLCAHRTAELDGSYPPGRCSDRFGRRGGQPLPVEWSERENAVAQDDPQHHVDAVVSDAHRSE